MSKMILTDRALASKSKFLPAADGRPYDVSDGVVPGMALRVMGSRQSPVKTFVLVARYRGSKNPTRRALGSYGDLTLEQAEGQGQSMARTNPARH